MTARISSFNYFSVLKNYLLLLHRVDVPGRPVCSVDIPPLPWAFHFLRNKCYEYFSLSIGVISFIGLLKYARSSGALVLILWTSWSRLELNIIVRLILRLPFIFMQWFYIIVVFHLRSFLSFRCTCILGVSFSIKQAIFSLFRCNHYSLVIFLCCPTSVRITTSIVRNYLIWVLSVSSTFHV